ncbi:hypothetical protein BDF19DRAFT_437880 [Syncephalis fuscata]|nr:hypothetical protein BDF19DRAFT_437880 [Syncephalis fuscata]
MDDKCPKLGGIALHPSGEQSLYDFYFDVSGDIKQQRIRLISMQAHTMLLILVSFIFLRNFVRSARMIHLNNRSLSLWCCFAGSLPGAIFSIQIILIAFDNVSCRILIWIGSLSLSCAQFCNSLLLLRKAYIIVYRQKWLLYIGFPLILPQLGYGLFIVFLSYVTTDVGGACGMHYPSFIPWYWFGINAASTILFSTIFCRVAYKQYCQFGSDAWKRLAHNGIQAMCLAVLCNIVCCFLIIFRVAGNYSDMLFPLDW